MAGRSRSMRTIGDVSRLLVTVRNGIPAILHSGSPGDGT
jgi:hypothetical protein